MLVYAVYPHLITFSRTSSKEADTIFHDFKRRILLPALLPVEQLKRESCACYKERLTQAEYKSNVTRGMNPYLLG